MVVNAVGTVVVTPVDPLDLEAVHAYVLARNTSNAQVTLDETSVTIAVNDQQTLG